jgi:predicted dinucleotide-binding enzyme
MRIAILGAGQVGGRLGRVWAAAGHEVVFGLPEHVIPDVQVLLAELGDRARAVSVAEAAAAGAVVVVATPPPTVQDVIAQAGDLTGKVLVDCVNPLLPDFSVLSVAPGSSLAEEIARWAPGARVVKAFNTVAASTIGNASLGGTILSCFYCGDDAEAKAIVSDLIARAGFDPIDAGTLDKARMLEAFALFYIHLAVKCGLGGDFALTVVRR